MDKILKDREAVLEAVKEDGLALQYVSEELRGDKEVVLEAVRESGKALKYASEELKHDPEILKVLEEQKQEKQKLQHTPQKIAEGIAPTQTVINEVQAEMISEQTRKARRNRKIENLEVHIKCTSFLFINIKFKENI